MVAEVSDVRNMTRPPMGWAGKTLQEMLAESERLLVDTGHYYGVNKLSLKENDPIRYEKIWSRLRGGIVGARETALNISASPIVREIGELCFGLYTPEGDSITLSTGIMAHVHTMSEAIKHMVRAGYEEDPGINPGDIFTNNDPQLGDVHNADVQEFLPIIYEGELVGWAAGVTHETDVGAPQPASMPIGTVSRYEDGFIVSCQKVGTNDRIHRDYENRITTAVRTPFYWILDERCRIAGCQIMRENVLRVIEEEGLETYKTFIREVIEDTRQAFQKNLKLMTVPGIYRFPSFMDVPHSIDKGQMPEYAAVDSLMNCPMELRIGTDLAFEIDLDGANKWGYHSFNCTPSGIQGGLWVGLSQTLIPNDKVNDGAYLATKFNTPYGTWANPDNPAVSNTLSWMYLIPCFTGMFHGLSTAFTARGYVEEVVAAYPFTGNITQGGGPNHMGNPNGAWSNFEHSACGTSARYVMDGETSCAAVWNPEGDMGDVEAWELLEPLLYLGRNVRPMSGGAGKFRGGLGFETVRLVYNTPHQVMFNARDGHVFQCSGLFGGYPGATGYRHSVKNTDMKERIAKQLPYPTCDQDPENSQIDANVKGRTVVKDQYCYHRPDPHQEYDVYLSLIAGGHGVGDCLERDVALVVSDLNEGYLFGRFAERLYGVVAQQGTDGTWTADLAATEAKRAEMRKARLVRSQSVEEWMAAQRGRVERMEFNSAVRKMYRESHELSPKWRREFTAFWRLPADWTPGSED
ncbi:MAG: hydantoinase B/oxoprolinase family protein [Gammaproteobacteria bacterium]|nr:hydantoinase B/oxoprolinase family protein [Gammaproteobacteria bacterium]